MILPLEFPNGRGFAAAATPICNKPANPMRLAAALAAATGADDDHDAEATALEAAMPAMKHAPLASYGELVHDPYSWSNELGFLAACKRAAPALPRIEALTMRTAHVAPGLDSRASPSPSGISPRPRSWASGQLYSTPSSRASPSRPRRFNSSR
jgi:hypothetical protein